MHIQLELPLHKIIFAFKNASRKAFFSKLVKISDSEKHYYEATLDFEAFPQILKHEEDELA